MILKRRVALNGQQLDQVDNRIVISGIEPADGRESIGATDNAAGYGQRVTSNRRSTLDIVVRFKLLEHGKTVSGLEERAELLEKVNKWAAPGGVLTVNYKPGRRLNVILVQAPGEGSLWDYTKEFALTFRAYTIPYWEDSTVSTETITAPGTIDVDGSANTQADVTLTNGTGETINTLSFRVGEKTMAFTSLGLADGESLVVDHNAGVVRIRIRSGSSTYRSAMAKRTDSSANDLMIAPGTSKTISYNANGETLTMTVTWRSRYL